MNIEYPETEMKDVPFIIRTWIVPILIGPGMVMIARNLIMPPLP